MSTEENKKVVLRWIEQAWEKKNLDVIDELHAPDYVGHIVGTPGPVRGCEALKQLLAAFLAGFDLHRTNEFLTAEGDKMLAYDTYRVKHKGEFAGIPPTGKELSATGIDIYRRPSPATRWPGPPTSNDSGQVRSSRVSVRWPPQRLRPGRRARRSFRTMLIRCSP
jgi:predicted ester cyclase